VDYEIISFRKNSMTQTNNYNYTTTNALLVRMKQSQREFLRSAVLLLDEDTGTFYDVGNMVTIANMLFIDVGKEAGHMRGYSD
jgi:hypothetical protein